MNRNLSSEQFGNPSMSSSGAMPTDRTFDGDSAPHLKSQQGVASPNEELRIPKPGFF